MVSLFFLSLQHGTTLHLSVPDPDFEIRGARSSIPLDKRWGGLKKMFSALWALVWSKNKGGAGASPGSATVLIAFFSLCSSS